MPSSPRIRDPPRWTRTPLFTSIGPDDGSNVQTAFWGTTRRWYVPAVKAPVHQVVEPASAALGVRVTPRAATTTVAAPAAIARDFLMDCLPAISSTAEPVRPGVSPPERQSQRIRDTGRRSPRVGEMTRGGHRPVTYIIAQPCVDVLDKACIEECPVDCIYEGNRMLYIHPDECVDCGACEPVCPVEAIFYEDDVPEQWKEYYKVNVDFFEELGSPGGASKVGKIEKDHPTVAALPPQETEH